MAYKTPLRFPIQRLFCTKGMVDMIIGVPKEIMQGEGRVAAIPETVKKFISDGFEVLVESGAGEGSHYQDIQYKEAGAEIICDTASLYSKSDIILKVKEPLFNEKLKIHETDLMKKGQYLITFLHPASPANHDMVRSLAAKGIIALTLDGVPRISRAQKMDALTSMSTCAGYKGMLIAADRLMKFMPQMFTAVGMVKPSNVLVIGTGVAGLQAIATAKRLGAVVYAADIRSEAAEQAKSLGAKIVETNVPPEQAVGVGGYAKNLSDQWLEVERDAIGQAAKNMDIVFCSALVPGKRAPVLITEDIVKSMAPGSVIVDISIDQGGNCEITPPGAVETKHGVSIVGIKNIPGLLPMGSTWMFANNVYCLVQFLSKNSSIRLDTNDEIVRSILVTMNGKIVHVGTLEAMSIS
jgi:NAD(P) transhydrogenase subunit alpha